MSLQWFMRMDGARRAGDRCGATTVACASPPIPSAAATWSGWGTSARGASRGSCGGATRSRSGTAREETYVGTEPPAGEGWERDPDVLDTWFSSALWPFATLGWPQATPQLRAFYPTDVLSTARDIIFLWVARMVMMGLEFTEQVPFSEVYVHSIIQAPDGRRMSKSLGTGIDPMALIEGGAAPAGVRRRRGLSGLRRRCGALGAAGDVLGPGRALRRGQGRAGPGPDQQAVERRPADPARRRRGRPRRVGGRAGGRRGPLDPQPPGAGAGRDRRPPRRASTSRARRSASTTSSTASCATGTSSSSSRGCAPASHEVQAVLLHVLAETLGARSPADPVRDRGDLEPGPGGRRAARGRAAG